MSLNITDHFRQTFADSFGDAVQQKNSRLMKAAQVETGCTGTAIQIANVLATEDEETTGQRYKKVVLKDLETNSRWIYPQEFQIPTGESKWDEKKLAPTVMPGGKHVVAHANAYARRCDKVLVNGLLGENRTGKTGETATTILTGHVIPVDFVATGSDANSKLTPAKVIEAVRLLVKAEAWNEDVRASGVKLFGLLDSDLEASLKQYANLNTGAAGDRLFSADFGLPPVYDDNGFLKYWLGVNWISYEGLLTGTGHGTASESTSIKKSAIWTSDGLHFKVWEGISTSVDKRPDISNAVQFLSQYMLGAGRDDEKKVVQINCLV